MSTSQKHEVREPRPRWPRAAAPQAGAPGEVLLGDGAGPLAELSPLERHDLVTAGLPVVEARRFVVSYRLLDRDDVLRAVGISERTLQRGTAGERLLDANASDRALRLASVTEQAVGVLGSRDAAERWLASPATGLDRRRPIDLLQSSEGAELVRTLLTRMEYGVYA
ncbi:type II RES/Xre toxin-antitoxin system antitoxin [Xylophilus sp.]|uniref:type II RES/Xre toxin-antitoxin system antitoxin n=1 Tax=Xylophilus sp. TaxID=2653893 RepID=UPI0013B5EFB7|nr:antitoxin Xre/MbcA/ParS toxin-binding domain-containing protein [Xylophilus sp.]KAF1048794.1 MAG: hypothetical protein GAK38_01238 [Xylophilus sp.]